MLSLDLCIIRLADFSDDAAQAAGSGVTMKAQVSAVGTYQRAPFRFSDTSEIDGDQLALLESYQTHLEQPHGGIDHAVLSDAMVTGQGTVITRDFCLIRESALEFLAGKRAPDGCQLGPSGEISLTVAPNRHVERPTLLLQRPWFANYGHWLVDSAALLALIARVALPTGWQIVVGEQNATMRAIVHDTVRLLAPGVDIVERPMRETWQFQELHYLTPVHVPALYKHPEALSCLRSLILRSHFAIGAHTRKLFISRGKTASRQLANEDEIIVLCESFGFEVVRPERLTLEAQAALFRSAQVVVGVKGAALTNTLFCAAGSHLIALSPSDFPDPFFWDLATQGGVHYSEIFGRLLTRDQPQGHGSFMIDPTRLRTVLAQIVTGPFE